jgi:hypothetical protein
MGRDWPVNAVIQDLLPVAGSTGHFYGMPTPVQVIGRSRLKNRPMDEKPVSQAESTASVNSAREYDC